nr:MAG TPA: tail tape measure [Caudoviricetes sp.]
MAELKIRIEGDATGATKALEDVKNSSDFTWKSISQLINNLQKVDKALLNGTATAEDLDKAQRQLVNSFERFANSAIAGGNEVSAYNDIIKKANSVVQKLDANIQSANLSEPFKAAAKSVQQYKDELSATQSKAENTLARNKATALGDNYTLYSLDYKELDSQLTRILQKEGKVTAESQKLANQMVKLKASMDKAGKTDLGTRMKNLAASFISAQAAVWAIQKAFSILKKVMVDSAAAASKAEETANLFNTTFSNIEGTANNVASNLSSSLGVATSSAQQMIGLFGDLAMGYGQTQTAALEFADQAVKTGLDIISFKNLTGDTTELLQSMASGLAGNFENFRKWGIIVTQTEIKQRLAKKGLDKLTGSAYQYAKVQETLAIVQEKSKNAIGDMAKTLDSTENINRRLGEANKELLETMGSGINEILNPVKKVWIGIATEINKATKAQKEYATGSKNIQIYDIANNEKDRKSFASDIKLGADTRIFGYASLDNNDVAMSNFIENAKKQMVIYNATAEETIKVIKESVTLNWKGQLDEISRELKEFGETLKKENDAIASLETRRSALESANSSARNFLDSLNGISGVNTNVNIAPYSSEVFTRSDNLANVAQNGLARNLEQAIQQAIASLDSSTWKEFADPIKLALGEITEDKGIESKLDAIKSVYELIYNEHLKDGKLTEQESADLEHIVSLYKEIQDEQTKKASFSSALSSVTGFNRDTDIKTLGFSEEEKELFNLENAKKTAEAVGLTLEQQEELNKAYEQSKATIEEYYETQEKIAKQEEEIAKEKERALDAQKELVEWQKKAGQFGMSEREIQYADLKEGKDNGTYTSDEYEKIKSYMDEFFSLEDAEAKAQEFQSLIDSSFGEAINIFKQMSSSMGWVGMLMELVSQTEAYQELMSVLTDSILPVLNAFLEPLLPMIKMAGDYIMTITQAVLIPLFPVLKKIAWVATFVIGILNVAYGFVADVIKKIVGTIQYGILTVYNWIVRTLQKINIFGWKPFGWMSEADTSQAQDWMNTDIMGNAKDRLNEMNKHLASIDAMTMDIKDNTSSKKDISAYEEMLHKGILTVSEYTALVSKVNGKNYDNVYTYQGSEYYKGAGGSRNIYYGGVTITIDGTDLDAEEITKKVAKEVFGLQENEARPGQKTYA